MTSIIAVIDDDESMVRTLCDILELHGWSTVRGYNGEDAITIVREKAVEIVLMDIRMPGLNGVDALEEIKRIRPRTRVVLFTASAAQELLLRAERAGAAKILRKPVDARELLAVLDGLRQERDDRTTPIASP